MFECRCVCVPYCRFKVAGICNSHLRPSCPPPPASPGHPSGPLSTCQARPQSPSASSASAGAHLHAVFTERQTESDSGRKGGWRKTWMRDGRNAEIKEKTVRLRPHRGKEKKSEQGGQRLQNWKRVKERRDASKERDMRGLINNIQSYCIFLTITVNQSRCTGKVHLGLHEKKVNRFSDSSFENLSY